ncbi:putative ribonuclease H-like domain-containing protein [Tanacetum coccineum]
MEFDAETCCTLEDGLGDFDWSNKADDTPVSLALMATNSEVPYCSKCSKSYKKLLESYQTERDNFQKARTEILGYQMSLESLEVILKTHEKNEYAWGDKYEQMEYDLKIRDLKLEEKQKELDQALKERDDFKVKLEKWSNASVLQNEVLNKQRYLSDKTCIGFGVESSSGMESDNSSGNTNSTDSLYENFKREKAYKAVPPPTGTIIPPRANVSFTGIDELAIRNKVLNQENTKSSQPEIDRNKVIIEDWVDSDDEETDFSEIQKKTVFNSENSETSFENKYSETSFENKSPNSQNSVGQGSRKMGVGHKGGKLCFVCYSPNHLIKDCNFHERTFNQTQTHKPKGTQGSRDTRPVWNNINRVNHSNFTRNSRYPQQRRSFIPSAVLTRDGLISTARPKMTQTVPSKSTANVTYQGTARSRVPQAVLSRSTDGSYYPRMDNRRPRISSYSPSSRSSTTRTPHRPQRPKKVVKLIWVKKWGGWGGWKKGSTVGSQAVLPQTVKKSAMISPKQTWKPKGNYLDSVNRGNGSYTLKQFEYGNPEEDLKDYAIIDSGCSGSMTGDKDKLSDFKEFKGGYVAFGNDSKGGRISGKGTIKTSCLDFEKVSYVEELKLLISYLAPRKNDVYSLDLKNIIPSGGITCLVAKATEDEAVLWHRRLGHRKGKQHRASCKKIEERTVREPLELLHMDLFGPVSVESINKKKYCLVVTDDCSKFSWVFFLAYKDETYDMLHDLIVGLENRLRHKVKTISVIWNRRKEEKINLQREKNMCLTVLSIKTANTPPQSTGNTPTDSDDDTPQWLVSLQTRGPKKVSHALADESMVEAMQEELRTIQATRDDVKSAFVYCNITEAVYVKPPPGFEDPAQSNQVINDVPHIRAKVAGKKILISEATIRADLLFDDENGVDCFPKQVIWDLLRDIGSDPKSTSWEQFGTNIASALVGLATNQKFNFSLMILTGMLGHISNGTPFLIISARDCEHKDADFQGTADPHDAASIPKSPNDYTPTDVFQTSGGDEGLLDIYALNREVRRLKKQTLSQAKQILKLKAKLKKLSKFVQPVVKYHALWVENQNLKKQKRRRKKHKKQVSSVKLGRNKDEGILSEEHKVQEEDLAHPFFDDTADQDAAVTPDLERKSDETEEVNIEEKEASNVKSGDTEELDLETTQSTARQGTITPRILNFEEEAGPSSPLRPIQVMDSEEQHNAAEVLVSISRPRGLSIPGPIQTQPQQPTQGTDPKDKGKGILVEEPKKKKLTLQQIRALETTNDEEVARKIQAEWDAEEERKRFEELKKTKPKTTLRKPTSLAQERNQMMSFLKGQGYKNLQKLKYPQMKELYDKVQASIKDSFKDFIPMDSEKEREMLKERDAKRLLRKRKATISEEQPSKKPKLRTETIDELRNYLRVVDFEKSVTR